MEKVEERHQRLVTLVEDALARVVGEVQRQRAVGAEQAEEALHQLRRALTVDGAERGNRCRREGQRRLLTQPQRLVGRPYRLADARLVRMQAFHAPQHGVEVVRVRLVAERAFQGAALV